MTRRMTPTGKIQPSNIPPTIARVLATLAAVVLAALGALAIRTETHSGYARFQGNVTLLGEQAVSMGVVLLCMALLPLVVWIPRRWVGWTMVAWACLLIGTIATEVFKHS